MIESVIDASGRDIQLRRIGVLEQLRLYKALGPQLSMNDAYMSMVFLASSAAMIDGVPVPFPNGEAGLETLLERLGDEGMTALASAKDSRNLSEVVDNAGNS